MTQTRYTYATTVSFGEDEPTPEFEVEVSYLVCWGAPEQGPSYASGGQPADPDELDDIRLDTVDGKPRPWNLGPSWTDNAFAESVLQILENPIHQAAMLERAAEQSEQDPDDARAFRDEPDFHAGLDQDVDGY